jgi:hypothetical protein
VRALAIASLSDARTHAPARHFRQWWESHGRPCELVHVGDSAGDMRAVVRALERPKQGSWLAEHRARDQVARIALFCAGDYAALELCGLGTAGRKLAALDDLAAALTTWAAPAAVVTMHTRRWYRGEHEGPGCDGGIADVLRDRCVDLGHPIRVDAYERSAIGHTRSVHVRRFEGEIGGTGGSWIVRPGSALWGRWQLAQVTGLRWQAAHLDTWEIHERLQLCACGHMRQLHATPFTECSEPGCTCEEWSTPAPAGGEREPCCGGERGSAEHEPTCSNPRSVG